MERFGTLFLIAGLLFFAFAFVVMGFLPWVHFSDLPTRTVAQLVPAREAVDVAREAAPPLAVEVVSAVDRMDVLDAERVRFPDAVVRHVKTIDVYHSDKGQTSVVKDLRETATTVRAGAIGLKDVVDVRAE